MSIGAPPYQPQGASCSSHKILSLLALLVQKHKRHVNSCIQPASGRIVSVYLLNLLALLVQKYARHVKSCTQPASGRVVLVAPGTQFTCFTSAKVQILTAEELRASRAQVARVEGGAEARQQEQQLELERRSGLRTRPMPTPVAQYLLILKRQVDLQAPGAQITSLQVY
jgi:hypothetical protein